MGQFGQRLKNAFQSEAAKATFSEVQLFRALIKAFGALRSNFYVEEYHGSKHQVYFNGYGTWGRTPARCELCDVLFVAYRTKPTFAVRLTFLQAKLSRERHDFLCHGSPTVFKANLEQWDLLARRPDILPVPPFDAHPLLLKDAALASVGSFGVFHRSVPGGVGFFFSSADCLSIVGAPSTKNGRLATHGGAIAPTRTVGAYVERTFCCCLPTFGDALYSMELGTAVLPASTGGGPSPLAQWLAGVLRSYSTTIDSTLARELLGFLDAADVPDRDAFATPSLVLVKTDAVG